MELAGRRRNMKLDILGLHVVDRHRVACPRPLIRTELVEIKRHVTPVAGQHSALDLIGIEHLLCLGGRSREQQGEAEQQARASLKQPVGNCHPVDLRCCPGTRCATPVTSDRKRRLQAFRVLIGAGQASSPSNGRRLDSRIKSASGVGVGRWRSISGVATPIHAVPELDPGTYGAARAWETGLAGQARERRGDGEVAKYFRRRHHPTDAVPGQGGPTVSSWPGAPAGLRNRTPLACPGWRAARRGSGRSGRLSGGRS